MDNWFDITRSDQYKELSPEDRIAVKQRFFERFMLPKMDEDPDLADPNVKQATYIKFMQSPDDTGEGFVRSMAGAAARGFGEMVPGTVEGVGALTGIQPLREAGQAMREGLEYIAPVNPIYAEGIPAQVANVAGNVGGIMATGGVGGAIGKGVAGAGRAAQAIQTGARSAVLGTGFAQGAAGKARENEQLGITGPEAYLNILGGGLAQTLPEVLPFGTALETAAARRLLGGADEAGRVIPGVRMSAAQEGVEGAASQVLSNISTQLAAPEGVQTPGIFEGVGEAALWESVGGGMFGVINKLGRTPPERQTPQQQQAAAEFNASPVDQKPDITPEESLQNAQQGGIPVVSPDGDVAWLPAMREAITQPAIQGPTQPSAVEQRLQTAISLAETAATNPEASQAAAAAAQVINEVAQTAPIETPPLSEGAERNRAVIAEAAAKLRGQAPQDISAGLQAAIPPSPEMEMTEKPSQTITGFNGEIAPEMPVPEAIPGEAPIQPVETQEDAIQEQIPDEGVLRQERPEMELQAVGEGNVQPEEVAREGEVQEEVAPSSLPSGRHRFSKTKLSKLPKQVVDALMQRKTSLDNSFNFISSPSIDLDEDSYYTLINPATGESRRLTTPGEFAGTATGKNVVKPTANIPLPKGAFVVYQKKTSGGGMSLGVVEGSFEAPKTAITPQGEPTTATEGMVTPGGVATERDLSKPEQMTPEEVKARVSSSAENIDIRWEKLKSTPAPDGWRLKNNPPIATETGDGRFYVLKQSGKYKAYDSKEDALESRTKGLERSFKERRMKAWADHNIAITKALQKNLPVSAAAVDTYGIKLPDGYTLQGDLYVFQPQTTKAAAETQISGSVMMSPLVKSMLETFAKASAAWSKAKSAIREQLSGTKEAVYLALAEDDFTMSQNGNVVEIAIPKSGSDAFSLGGLGIALDKYFRFGEAKGVAKVTKKAGKPFQITFGNERDASDFMQYDGRTPSQLNEDFKRLYQQLSESQPQAAETQTPVPLREGTGAAGVVQSEPVEGSIPTVEKVSPETETTSTEKADVVSSVDRLLESNASSEEMDMFVKTLTDDQFNELVRSEGYDVDPKLTIKPKDSYDAKRMKRRELVNQLRKEVVANQRIAKTAQQVIQQEEAEAKKQLAGEEMRSKALDSIIGNAEKKDREFGQVQVADAAQAMAILQNSGEVPGVLTAWVGNSKDFLADPQNEQIDPEVYNRVKRSGPDEGLFNKGRVYIFLDGIGVSEKDRLRGENLNISPQVAAVRRVLLHESLVHKGIHGLPLRHRRLILNWVKQNAMPEDLDKLAELYTEYRNWRTSTFQFEALAEEYLAKQVDQLTELPKDGPMARLMDILRQIWEYIVGYKKEPTLTDLKSVVKLLKSGAQAVANDRLKDGGGVKLSMIAPTVGITPEMDAEYMAAVEAGDMQTAQRMVDEAARAAGYNVGPVYHGTAEQFNVFDSSIRNSDTAEYGRGLLFFTNNQKLAAEYSKTGRQKYKELQGKIAKAVAKWSDYAWSIVPDRLKYLANWENEHRLTTPLNDLLDDGLITREQYDEYYRLNDDVYNLMDELANLPNPEGTPTIMRVFLKIPKIVETDASGQGTTFGSWDIVNVELADRMQQENADGFLAKDVYDSPFGTEIRADVYAVRTPSQIKSADPVTRDDQGNVIPLSQRFQPTSSDIRFSKVDFSTPSDALLNTGSEVSRDTLYDARIIGIRNAIRQAYDAMPKTNSVAVPIGELLSKTQEFAPDVTADEFSSVLQDMFEDNGAVLQEGISDLSVTTQEGKQAGFVVVMPSKSYEQRISQTNINSILRGSPFGERVGDGGIAPEQGSGLAGSVVELLVSERGVYGEESDLQRLRQERDAGRMLRGIDAIRSFLEKNGIPARVAPDAKAPFVVSANPDGTGELKINPSLLQEVIGRQASMQDAYSLIEAALLEEMIHAADDINMRSEWESGGKQGTFSDFIIRKTNQTVAEINDLIRNAENPSQASAIIKGIVSNMGAIYNKQPFNVADPVHLAEMIRQVAQKDLTGQITEQVIFKRMAQTIIDLFDKVLSYLRSSQDTMLGATFANRVEMAKKVVTEAMSGGIKASKVDPENAAAKRLKEDADAASAGSVRANFGGVPFKDYEGTSHITKTKKSYEEAAVRFVDDLVNQGISINDIADSVMSPAFLERVGIKDDIPMINGVIFEVTNRVTNTLSKTRDAVLRKRLQRKLDDLFAFSQGVRSPQGQNFALLQHQMRSPRYSWMFIFDMFRKQQKQDVQNVVAQNVTNPDELKAGVDADAQASADAATEQNVQAAENATGTQEDVDDDADLRAGEATLNEKQKSIWEKIKDAIRTKGLITQALEAIRAKKAGSQPRASISKDARNAIFQMTEEELLALDAQMDKVILDAEKDFFSEEPAVQKKRKKMVDVAKKRAEKGKSIDPAEAEAAAIEIAENKASQIVYRFEELYRQGFKNPPEGMSKKEQEDSIIRAFRDQVRNPVSFEQFAERLSNLKVGDEVAERMFLTASRERADLIRVKQFRIEKRRVEIADKQASRLIYSTEERLRQGSKDLETSKDGDSINRAFREQVSDPMSQDDFVKRLAKLNVSADVANRLFKTAAREKTDLEAMKAYELLEGPDALARMLRELNRARPGEQAPLSRQIPWRTILSQKASTVAEYRQRIFDVVASNEAFANLTDEQKLRFADVFAQAWEQNRTRILDSMLENRIRQEQARNNLTKAGAEALQKQRMKLVEDLNLGILDNEQLMIRLAEKFGIKAEYTEQEREQIDKLLDILQDEKTNAASRMSTAFKLLSTLSDVSKVPLSKIIADLWVTSVLSGFNTIFSIGAAVASGAFELLSGFSRVIRTGFRNPQEVPGAIVDSFKAFRNMLAAFPMSARASWQYLVTGDRLFLDPSMNDITKDLNYEQIGRTTALAENLAKSENKLAKVVGLYMRTVSRLLTALDNFNSTSTKFGSLPIVFRSLKLTPEKIAQLQEKNNLQMYIERVIRNDFNGVHPKNMNERATVEAYARAEMMKDLDELGRVSENADFYGMQGAMTFDPTGIGGAIYKGLRDFTGGMSKSADNYIAAAKRRWQIKEDPALDFINLASAYFMQFIAYNASNMAGFRFARFAGNKFNQGLSFIPGVGMLRKFEADSEKNPIRGKEAFIDMIDRNQMAGMALAVIGYVLLEAIADEPDDEKRGWAINGGWGNLTPEKKKQLLAAGMKEYTIRIGDKVYNYINWPISSALAAIGGLSDLIRFSPEAWDEKDVVSRLGTAAASGIFAATDIPALSTVQELFGSNLSSKDPVANKLDRLARVMSGYAGGFVPRILKDFDYLAEPGLRKYETLWEKTASHIPVYRRHVGEEYYDILGRQIERKVYPGSREFLAQPTEPEYRILGALNSRGIWLTPANAEHRMVGRGSRKRNLTQEEADAYSLETGRGYRQMLLKYGQRALRMPTERAQAFLQDLADDVRDRALMRVYRGYRPAE